jgi:hypothetical protein
MAQKIIRHELVEIVIPANSSATRFQFPDIPNLRNSHIWGLQAYFGGKDERALPQIEISTLSQNIIVNSRILTLGFVTLVNYGGKEFLKQAPIVLFNTLNNFNTVNSVYSENNTKSFVGQKTNYPKSYIETSVPISTEINQSVLFSIYYSLQLEEEKKESGYSFSKRQ